MFLTSQRISNKKGEVCTSSQVWEPLVTIFPTPGRSTGATMDNSNKFKLWEVIPEMESNANNKSKVRKFVVESSTSCNAKDKEDGYLYEGWEIVFDI
jgi:hypothetical protein